MVRPQDLVVDLRSIDKDDVRYVGGKGANLGEMLEAGFSVPSGFVITANAYELFLQENSLDKKILHLLGTVDFKNTDSISQVTTHIRKLIKTSKIPDVIVKQVFEYYSKLGKNAFVAIRSSATSEDSKTASFAGQNETFLDIIGEANVIDKVRSAWASYFEPRSVYYRHENNVLTKGGIALVVQKMIESEISGVMFTIDPVTNNKEKVVIEAIYGLGEYIVQGKVTPDHYEVNKRSFNLETFEIEPQSIMLTKVKGQAKESKVPRALQKKQKLKDSEVILLAKLAEKIEHHYYFPQDIEWAKENGKFYIVQTRPITTTGERKKNQAEDNLSDLTKPGKPILVGDPASPGIGIGVVKILKNPKEIGKIKQGDILVAPYTNPDYVPAMKKAAAIITETGGRTSHAAIVSREFGIPAVVGLENAIKHLKDGMPVTVNGSTGEIFSGSVLITQKKEVASHFKTATKLYVNLAEPELASTVASKNIDGIGLLRAEFMIAEIGIHPKKLIEQKKQSVFVNALAEKLAIICRAFFPRPVLYRATDFKTNEYRNLTGGKDYEPIEPNPMLGYRGAFRYVSDPQVFQLELEAIKRVRNTMNLTNLNLMVPFVRTIDELREVKKEITKSGLSRSHSFKLFMMCEIPSNVILIEEFIKEGIDGVSIGSNDLTMLVLGTDRDNAEVASVFDERDPAVLWAIERVIKACHKYNIPVSICGQAPSVYPSLVEQLVSWGITSISVSPDAIDDTRNILHRAEQKIILKK